MLLEINNLYTNLNNLPMHYLYFLQEKGNFIKLRYWETKIVLLYAIVQLLLLDRRLRMIKQRII
jgi:hypothetical protein